LLTVQCPTACEPPWQRRVVRRHTTVALAPDQGDADLQLGHVILGKTNTVDQRLCRSDLPVDPRDRPQVRRQDHPVALGACRVGYHQGHRHVQNINHLIQQERSRLKQEVETPLKSSRDRGFIVARG